MPIRSKSIFENVAKNMNASVNRYVADFVHAAQQNLPIFPNEDLKGMKGKWINWFQAQSSSDKPYKGIVLEIGTHLGRSFIEMSRQNQDYGFVGLDITFKRVVSTAKKVRNHKIKNAVTILADAKHLEDLFEEEELSGIVAFFPDPWNQKKRQVKHQLFSEDYCKVLFSRLKAGGAFWFKTDQFHYYQQTKTFLENAGFILLESPTRLFAQSYESSFELMFKNQKIPFYEGQWQKI